MRLLRGVESVWFVDVGLISKEVYIGYLVVRLYIMYVPLMILKLVVQRFDCCDEKKKKNHCCMNTSCQLVKHTKIPIAQHWLQLF